MVVRHVAIRVIVLLWRYSEAVRDDEVILEASAPFNSSRSTREVFKDSASLRKGATELSEHAEGAHRLHAFSVDITNYGANMTSLPAPKSSDHTTSNDTGLCILAAFGIFSTVFVCVVFAVVVHYWSPIASSRSVATPEVASKFHTPESVPDGSDLSISSVQFFVRLEEIIEQLAFYLRTNVRTQLESEHKEPSKMGATTWYYFAAVPQTLANICTCGNAFLPEALFCELCRTARPEVGKSESASGSRSAILFRMERWASGSLAWWTSKGHFERGLPPAGAMYIDDVEDILYDVERNPKNVVVLSRVRALNRVFMFGNWKQAKTWASNLCAFIEQAHDEH